MTTNQLPDAPEMLKLPPEQFMGEVSRAVSPRPWVHDYGEGSVQDNCIHCGKHPSSLSRPCVPPIITDSLADVAEALRKKATINGRANLFRAVYHTMKNVAWPDMTSWWFDAPFKERIACCLVALGYWQVNKEKEKS